MKAELIAFLEEYERRARCLDIKSASYQEGWCDCLKDMINAAKQLPNVCLNCEKEEKI